MRSLLFKNKHLLSNCYVPSLKLSLISFNSGNKLVKELLFFPFHLKMRKQRFKEMMWFLEALTAYKWWSQDPDPELTTYPLSLCHTACFILSFWSTKTFFSYVLINHLFNDIFRTFEGKPSSLLGLEFQKSETLSQFWKFGQHLSFFLVFLKPLPFIMIEQRLYKSRYEIIYKFPPRGLEIWICLA